MGQRPELMNVNHEVPMFNFRSCCGKNSLKGYSDGEHDLGSLIEFRIRDYAAKPCITNSIGIIQLSL